MVYYFVTGNSAIDQLVDATTYSLQWGTTVGTIIFAVSLTLTIAAYFFYKI
jgi:hypothetical protein